jgi:hypothetical protein
MINEDDFYRHPIMSSIDIARGVDFGAIPTSRHPDAGCVGHAP